MSAFRHAVMKDALRRAPDGPLAIEERPVPHPAAHQLLIRVVASGVCPLDLCPAQGGLQASDLPCIAGHEAVGDVVAIGSRVTGHEIGERVGLPTRSASGRITCGAFAEYVVAEADAVVRIPEELDPFVATTILCTGVGAYAALQATDTQPGQWVLVSGLGESGLLAVQYARAMGRRVVAMDSDPCRRARAEVLGVALCVAADDAEAVAAAFEETGGMQGAVLTAGAQAECAAAVAMLRPGGTCVIAGVLPGDMALPIQPLVAKRLTVRGSVGGTKLQLAQALELAAQGHVHLAYETRRLEEINTVLDDLQRGGLRTRIVLDLRRPMGSRRVAPAAPEYATA